MADRLPWLDQLGKELQREFQHLKQLMGPASRPGVIKLEGAGHTQVHLSGAAQEVIEGVTDAEEKMSRLKARRIFCSQLEDGVDGHHLNPGFPEQLGPGDAGKNLFHPPASPGITIMVYRGKDLPLVIKKNVIEAPGVGTDTFKIQMELSSLRQPHLNLFEKLRNVPMQGVRSAAGDVGKAMDFAQLDRSRGNRPEHEATCFSTEIASEVVRRHGTFWGFNPASQALALCGVEQVRLQVPGWLLFQERKAPSKSEQLEP
jgi:hypothetical protein